MELRGCYAALSRREREVLALVVSGLPNKQVGAKLRISEITVKAHRGRVMRKMKAQSLAHLVTMAARLELPVVEVEGCERPGHHDALEVAPLSRIPVHRRYSASHLRRHSTHPRYTPNDRSVMM